MPAAFAEAISSADHRKAADYTVARQRLSRLEILIDAVVLLALTLGGGIARLREVAASFALPELLTGTLHVLLVFLVLAAISLPLSVWRTFVLEQRFGFNRTTPRTFIADLLKSLLLGGLLGGVVVATVLWIMATAGRTLVVDWLGRLDRILADAALGVATLDRGPVQQVRTSRRPDAARTHR